MPTTTETLNLAALSSICRTHHVRCLAIFGSFAREELRPNSDVDLLVEYEVEFTPTFFQLSELSEALRPIFGGRDIDLILPTELHWFIRDQVIHSAKTIYER